MKSREGLTCAAEGKGGQLSRPLGASDHAGSTQSTQTISFVGSSFTQLTAFPCQQLRPPLTQSRLHFPWRICTFFLLQSCPVSIGPQPTLAVPGHEELAGWAMPRVLGVALCSALGKPMTSQLPGSLCCSCLFFCSTPCSQEEGGTEPTAPSKVPISVGSMVTHKRVLGLYQPRP